MKTYQKIHVNISVIISIFIIACIAFFSPSGISAFSTQSLYSEKLIKNQTEIPNGKFRAYYFDTTTMEELVAQEVVERVYLNYGLGSTKIPYSGNFREYDSSTLAYKTSRERNLGAYWVGEFEYLENSTKVTFDITNPQWDIFRLYIDGKLVHSYGHKQSGTGVYVHTFSRGKHRIEMEYESHWHAGTFSVVMSQNALQRISQNEAKSKLMNSIKMLGQPDLLAASVYESEDEKEGKISLTFTNLVNPTILVLSSYNPVLWSINDSDIDKIQAIFVYSYGGGSIPQISGVEIPIYLINNAYIGNGDGATTSSHIGYAIGQPVGAMSYKYSTTTLTIPPAKKVTYNLTSLNTSQVTSQNSSSSLLSTKSKKNPMHCTESTKNNIANGEVVCYGIWDYGSAFGDDQSMCPEYAYSNGSTGCKIQIQACKSGKAIATSFYQPIKMDIASPDLAIMAKNLASTPEIVKKELPGLWEYTCYDGINIPEMKTITYSTSPANTTQQTNTNSGNSQVSTSTLKNVKNLMIVTLDNGKEVRFPTESKDVATTLCKTLQVGSFSGTLKTCHWEGVQLDLSMRTTSQVATGGVLMKQTNPRSYNIDPATKGVADKLISTIQAKTLRLSGADQMKYLESAIKRFEKDKPITTKGKRAKTYILAKLNEFKDALRENE